MIRDTCATVFALGALVWAGRLLWIGPPVAIREETPLRPWIDASCGSQIEKALDELAPKLEAPALEGPSPSGIAAAREALGGAPDQALDATGLALARCLDAAARHGVEARWQRSAEGSANLEAEFRAPVENAVAWWEEVLHATASSPLEPRSCRWSIVGPIASGAHAEIVGRLRLHVAPAGGAALAGGER